MNRILTSSLSLLALVACATEGPADVEGDWYASAKAIDESDTADTTDECILDFLASSYSAQAGTTVTVEWDTADYAGSRVYFSLFSGWGTTYYVQEFTDNDGSHDVTLPATLDPSLSYHFYIESAADDDVRTTICWDYVPLEVQAADPTLERRELCNCEDDDGDGLVDEGRDCRYPVSLEVTADDLYVAFADGVPLGINNDWEEVNTHTTPLTAGTHTLAAKVTDQHSVQAGFLASVKIAGVQETLYNTGMGSWYASNMAPATGWRTDVSLLGGVPDTSADASSCNWGSYWPADILADGATWIWDGDCSDPASNPENWFAVEIEVCPEAVETDPEVCNCEDDDGDGLVDEGLDCEYKVSLEITADDYYEAYLDSSLVGSDGTWANVDTFTTTTTAGTHLLSVVAEDAYNIQAGFIANLEADGMSYPTGYGDWVGKKTAPASGWMTSGMTGGISDDNLVAGSSCTSNWGSPSTGLDNVGAEWVWDKDCGDPASYPENWFQLEFQVCPEATR